VPSKPPSPERLHEATDRLNCALLEAEGVLRELNLGVPASVPLEEDRTLHFRKNGKQWDLLVVGADESSETHIRSTSRQTRLEVVTQLPALLEALLSALDAELRRVEGSIDSVHAFTSDLRRRHPVK
jgi:hypothetical protein